MAENPTTPVFKLPESIPSPSEIADTWSQVVANAIRLAGTTAERAADPHVPQAYDPAGPARAFGAFAAHLFTHPTELIRAQQKAAADWMELWGQAAARATGAKPEPLAGAETGRSAIQRPRLVRGAGLRLSEAGLSAHCAEGDGTGR